LIDQSKASEFRIFLEVFRSTGKGANITFKVGKHLASPRRLSYVSDQNPPWGWPFDRPVWSCRHSLSARLLEPVL